MDKLGGGCNSPIAAYSNVEGDDAFNRFHTFIGW